MKKHIASAFESRQPKPNPTKTRRQSDQSAPARGRVSAGKPQKKLPLYKIALYKLRDLILAGEFGKPSPGRAVQLSEASVQARLREENIKVGVVPIRRALLELDHEGLLEIRTKSGTFIREIKDDELGQLVRTRSVLEEFFVCTLARDVRANVYSLLEKAREVNRKIFDLQVSAANEKNSTDVFLQAVHYDTQFHDELANVAGYPHLKKQLKSVRYRLRLAQKDIRLTPENLLATFNDHEAILCAIRPAEDAWSGDIVRARLAIKSHLRNAADRLNLADALVHDPMYAHDPIMDLPQSLAPDDTSHTLAFGVLRTMLELVVAAEISKQEFTINRLGLPTQICSKMSQIAQQSRQKSSDEIAPATKAKFVNLDIQFHSSLAYISGLFFAQEAITHIWQQMYDDARRKLGGDEMIAVVDEHTKILRDLGYFSGQSITEGTERILSQVREHFEKAYLRANPDEEELKPEVTAFLTWFISQLSSTPKTENGPRNEHPKA